MSNGAVNTIIKAKLIKRLGNAGRIVGKLLLVTRFRPDLESMEQALVKTLTRQCDVFIEECQKILKAQKEAEADEAEPSE